MIHRLMTRTTVGLLLALGAAGSARAEGEDQGFSFHPSIHFSNVYDDEPGLGRPFGRSEHDFGWWIRPRAELGYESPELEVGADLGLDLRRYVHADELGDELWYASGFAEVGLLPGLSARLGNAFEPHYVQLGLPEDQGANLAQTNRSEGELRYWTEIGGDAEVELGGRASYFVSEHFPAMFPGAGGPLVDWTYRGDFWQTSGFVQSQAPVGRGTTTLLNVEAGLRNYADRLRADHVNVAATAGVRSERFENLELEMLAGYGLIDFDGLGSVQQPIGRMSLRHQLPQGFAWHALAANRFRSNLIGNEVFEATGEIGLEKKFQEIADASLELFVSHFEDRGAPSNLYGGLEIEVGRNLAAQTRLSLTYRHWRNAGDAGFDDMAQNSAFLTFSHRR
jgi:hypothetical protein